MTTKPWLTPSTYLSQGFSCRAAPIAWLVTATTTSGGCPASWAVLPSTSKNPSLVTDGQTNSTAADVYDADPGVPTSGTSHEKDAWMSPVSTTTSPAAAGWAWRYPSRSARSAA